LTGDYTASLISANHIIRKLCWNFGNRWPARHSRGWWYDCFWI